MDEIPILGRDDDRSLFKRVVAHYDAPAYVRRARQVEEAFTQLIARCRQQRDAWLPSVRTSLGQLQALAGDWTALQPLLADEEQVNLLGRLADTLAPQLRVPVARTRSPRVRARALRSLVDGISAFNRRWLEFLQTVDVSRVNELRAGYNRYYLLEKECAVRSVRVARQGFQPLAPLRVADLTELLPPLPVPRGKG